MLWIYSCWVATEMLPFANRYWHIVFTAPWSIRAGHPPELIVVCCCSVHWEQSLMKYQWEQTTCHNRKRIWMSYTNWWLPCIYLNAIKRHCTNTKVKYATVKYIFWYWLYIESIDLDFCCYRLNISKHHEEHVSFHDCNPGHYSDSFLSQCT